MYKIETVPFKKSKTLEVRETLSKLEIGQSFLLPLADKQYFGNAKNNNGKYLFEDRLFRCVREDEDNFRVFRLK